MEPAEETAKIVSQVMNQAADSYLGKAVWTIVCREKLAQITFPLPEKRQLRITGSTTPSQKFPTWAKS